MTVWKVCLISLVTTLSLVAIVALTAMLLYRGGGHGAHGFGSGIMGAHRMRALAFSAGHRDVCAHLSDASVSVHAEVATLWVDRQLELTDSQRAALVPLIDGMSEAARELAPLCDSPHDDARAAVSLAADVADTVGRTARRIDDRFDAFYDTLDESQRAQLDGFTARHRGMHHR